MVDCLKVVIPLSSVGMVDTPGTAGVGSLCELWE